MNIKKTWRKITFQSETEHENYEQKICNNRDLWKRYEENKINNTIIRKRSKAISVRRNWNLKKIRKETCKENREIIIYGHKNLKKSKIVRKRYKEII